MTAGQIWVIHHATQRPGGRRRYCWGRVVPADLPISRWGQRCLQAPAVRGPCQSSAGFAAKENPQGAPCGLVCFGASLPIVCLPVSSTGSTSGIESVSARWVSAGSRRKIRRATGAFSLPMPSARALYYSMFRRRKRMELRAACTHASIMFSAARPASPPGGLRLPLPPQVRHGRPSTGVSPITA